MDAHLIKCLSSTDKDYTMLNACIMAHIDHGKTTFADGLLSVNSIVPRQQVGKLRYLDSRSDEQERGITMKASSIMLNLDQFLINVIDTPGHVDLVHETAVAASLSDVCYVLVDLMEGVVAQTRTALLHARRFDLKCVLVLNKFDRLFMERNVKQYFDFYLAIEEIIAEANKVYGLDSEYTVEEERCKYFSMNGNNVIFGSAVDNWMCSMGHFEKYLVDNGFTFEAAADDALPIGQPRALWSLEEYYVSAKLKSVSREKKKSHSQLAIQILFDTIASLYNIESHSLDLLLTIYRKIMKDNDKVTPDETLLRRFQIREALPRLRKLLLETWMPLGVNSLEVISGKYSSEVIKLRNSNVVSLKDTENVEEMLRSDDQIVHIAKIFMVKEMLIGFCKNLSQVALGSASVFYLGSHPVSIAEFFLMNSTQLIPIQPHLIQPRQIFAVRLSSFASSHGDRDPLPMDSWRALKDTPIRVDSVLINRPMEQLFQVANDEEIKKQKSLNVTAEHSDQLMEEAIVPIFTASPVFKVIFLPKKRFIPGVLNDEESTAVYNLTFKLVTLSDKMLKVILKPNGFWELFFLGRLHYEKFLVDFRDTLQTVLKYHSSGLSLSEEVLDGLFNFTFERLNIIEQDRGTDSSPLLVAFRETITPNYFVYQGRGKRVTFTVGDLHFAPIFIPDRVTISGESLNADDEELKRIAHQNKWILQQLPGHAPTSDDHHQVDQWRDLNVVNLYKGNRLWTLNKNLDENLMKYLRIGSKMALEQGGPLCEEPLTGLDLLVVVGDGCRVDSVNLTTSLAISEAMKSWFNRNSSWFRLVVPLYEGHVLLSSETTSYQTVCNEVRRFDGKILDTNDSGLRFQLPVTESERFIDQIRKKCHGHVDVHFKFHEDDPTNWKRLDVVDEERCSVFMDSLEKMPIKVKLFEKNESKVVILDEDGAIVDKDESGDSDAEDGDEVFAVLDEDDEDDLNDFLELYDNMNKARVRPLLAQMRHHKGLFEEQNYESFTGEKQEKF